MRSPAPTPDVDPGYDDAVVLVLACGARDPRVWAVTTVAGNTTIGSLSGMRR